jgi:hypothetical protein
MSEGMLAIAAGSRGRFYLPALFIIYIVVRARAHIGRGKAARCTGAHG